MRENGELARWMPPSESQRSRCPSNDSAERFAAGERLSPGSPVLKHWRQCLRLLQLSSGCALTATQAAPNQLAQKA